jgi:hypothetical protein
VCCSRWALIGQAFPDDLTDVEYSTILDLKKKMMDLEGGESSRFAKAFALFPTGRALMCGLDEAVLAQRQENALLTELDALVAIIAGWGEPAVQHCSPDDKQFPCFLDEDVEMYGSAFAKHMFITTKMSTRFSKKHATRLQEQEDRLKTLSSTLASSVTLKFDTRLVALLDDLTNMVQNASAGSACQREKAVAAFDALLLAAAPSIDDLKLLKLCSAGACKDFASTLGARQGRVNDLKLCVFPLLVAAGSFQWLDCMMAVQYVLNPALDTLGGSVLKDANKKLVTALIRFFKTKVGIIGADIFANDLPLVMQLKELLDGSTAWQRSALSPDWFKKDALEELPCLGVARHLSNWPVFSRATFDLDQYNFGWKTPPREHIVSNRLCPRQLHSLIRYVMCLWIVDVVRALVCVKSDPCYLISRLPVEAFESEAHRLCGQSALLSLRVTKCSWGVCGGFVSRAELSIDFRPACRSHRYRLFGPPWGLTFRHRADALLYKGLLFTSFKDNRIDMNIIRFVLQWIRPLFREGEITELVMKKTAQAKIRYHIDLVLVVPLLRCILAAAFMPTEKHLVKLAGVGSAGSGVSSALDCTALDQGKDQGPT